MPAAQPWCCVCWLIGMVYQSILNNRPIINIIYGQIGLNDVIAGVGKHKLTFDDFFAAPIANHVFSGV